MSIRIDQEKCIGCGKCEKVCPGSLIALEYNRAQIKYPRDCWGCAACVKECPIGAISIFLGADIGGNGGTMRAFLKGDILHWSIEKHGKILMEFDIDRKVSNKY